MTERHFYKHVETGIVSEISDDVAAVFGDRLEKVDAPTDSETVTETDTSDSSKGGKK